MIEQESLAAVGGGAVTRVQAGHPLLSGGQNIVVARRVFGGSIGPVRKQRESHIAVRIREIVHFQPLDLLLHVALLS